MTDVELRKKLADTKDELFRLRFQSATGQLDNPMKIQEVRRRIARVKTVLRERELGIKHA
ncbi:LSU ribosomal protein L29p (L35e) [Candidatus Desulforudis audaxviator]|jgi:large subunit ribosomal protein L29|nr:LSU ribosomal protein L29p (L35e) [Candidatus Desulforudis audaxviator]